MSIILHKIRNVFKNLCSDDLCVQDLYGSLLLHSTPIKTHVLLCPLIKISSRTVESWSAWDFTNRPSFEAQLPEIKLFNAKDVGVYARNVSLA